MRFLLLFLLLLVPLRAEDIGDIIVKSEYHNVAPTGSMKPMFDERVWLLSHDPSIAPYESLEVGDVVFFKALWYKGDEMVCHEIVAISSNRNYMVTKGINNDRCDPYFLTKANYRGRIVGWIRKPHAPKP